MLHLIAGLVLSQSSAGFVQRDDFGVPHIKAPTWNQAFRAAGFAVAQDRLWQLENSRRLSRGRMAAAFGAAFVASDREVLLTGYTDQELQKQVEALSPTIRSAWERYCEGINEAIDRAKTAGTLPKQYADNGLEPEPWTILDSAAIAVRMGQMFGRGGAGEIRNLAMLGYLKTQAVKDRALDVFDDFAWQIDPRSIPTVPAREDPLAKNPPAFPVVSRGETERHVARLPNVGLFELLPGVRLASLENSRKASESRGAPFKVGSYAVVVGPGRSATGWPLLLSGPQMGFTNPSIIHEMSIEAPGLSVVGLDVPGIPGILIGHTRKLAWGLTSGVADTDDIYFSKVAGAEGYEYGAETRKLERIERTLAVRGQDGQSVVQVRTHYGPVVVSSPSAGVVFSRRSAYRGKELQAFDSLASLWSAEKPAEIAQAVAGIPLTFNLFYATSGGDIGYHYCGFVPSRAPGYDPRFPLPGEPAADWVGMIPPGKMPRLMNPASGLIANWNNKPATWWPNLDTPAWGRIFRNQILLEQLSGRLSAGSLERAAWSIARRDEVGLAFQPRFAAALADQSLKGAEAMAAAYLASFDGFNLEGSPGATIHRAAIDALREEIFAPHTGTFLSADLFRAAAQPSLMLNALDRKTRFDYLGKRKPAEVLLAAFHKAVGRLASSRGEDPSLWLFAPGGIGVPGQPPIPYSNRGSYIQVVELIKGGEPRGRNVLPPGVAESGNHALDQAPLARAWQYKPMRWHKEPTR